MSAYIILGMHRSGTSVVSHILHECGIVMLHGQPLGPTRENKHGYFEDRQIIQINERILAYAGYKWYEIPEEEKIIKAGITLKEPISKLFGTIQKGKWGFKDPRACLTLPAILPHIENPHFIIVKRNIESNFQSFKKTRFIVLKDWMKSFEYFQQWYDYNFAQIDKYTANKPRIFVQYEDLFDQYVNTIQSITQFIDSDKTIYDLFHIVDKSARRY